MRYLIAFLLLLLPFLSFSQQVTGYVYDSLTGEPLPFATVKFDDHGHGIITDLNGKFEIDITGISAAMPAEVSYMSYVPKAIFLSGGIVKIYLNPLSHSLHEVVVKPPDDKIRHILARAIANKDRNNPDNYNWYRCRVYYKMGIDVAMPEIGKEDTNTEKKEMKNFLDNQHLFMSETYSIRTWKKPQQLQEDIIGSRISGFKKSMFTDLVTDVLPFHSYNDYINLNGKDYHNPVSKGYEQYYKFDLIDELMKGPDTVWILSFRPKGQNANELKGSVYINSDGYAISSLIASSADTILKRNVRIEQQYGRVTEDGESHWFPQQLNYIIDWEQKTKSSTSKTVKTITYHLKGNSQIDSVSWQEQKDFRFEKAHTVRLHDHADELSDTAWQRMRPLALDDKEQRSYRIIDSFGEKKKFDKITGYISGLPEGKISLGVFDADLKRLFSSNHYEGLRLGIGLQTNGRLIKWLSVGGWAGYGFTDAKWKYGLFTEVYADHTHEFVFKASYTDDINDPGRIKLSPDIDKNYLNTYLLQRVDEVRTYSFGIKKKLGYWNVELTGRHQEIIPEYTYALATDGVDNTSFAAREVSLNFRYAFAERTAPFFGRYYSIGSKYPVWYGKITNGILTSGKTDIPYTQALTAMMWHKHINRIGNEHFLLEGGISLSNSDLPLAKLFAGAGYKYDERSSPFSLYTFGGFMTLYPYQYYSDRFVSFVFRHDFDWKLYKVKIPGSSLSSAPFISLQYNVLYGSLQHPEAQKYVAFSVADNAYNEAGILLNSLARLNYFNLYYLTLNMGYFYHLAPSDGKNGKFVVGVGVEF